MVDKGREWVKAAIKLSKNPQELVLCPECKIGTLIVTEVPFGKDRIDRYLRCDNCKKQALYSYPALLKEM